MEIGNLSHYRGQIELDIEPVRMAAPEECISTGSAVLEGSGMFCKEKQQALKIWGVKLNGVASTEVTVTSGIPVAVEINWDLVNLETNLTPGSNWMGEETIIRNEEPGILKALSLIGICRDRCLGPITNQSEAPATTQFLSKMRVRLLEPGTYNVRLVQMCGGFMHVATARFTYCGPFDPLAAREPNQKAEDRRKEFRRMAYFAMMEQCQQSLGHEEEADALSALSIDNLSDGSSSEEDQDEEVAAAQGHSGNLAAESALETKATLEQLHAIQVLFYKTGPVGSAATGAGGSAESCPHHFKIIVEDAPSLTAADIAAGAGSGIDILPSSTV